MKQPKYKDPEPWIEAGAEVYYRSIINKPHDGVVRKIMDKPWKLGHGAWVVSISGISGGVSIEAIDQVTPPVKP